MAQKSIRGSMELARRIKHRRNELNLTIAQAASRAGVGTKTWSRYEAGESIRRDKYKGICKALNWRDFPAEEHAVEKRSAAEEYQNHEAWSQFLADRFGPGAAMAFAAGSDILLDYIRQDLSDLASMPSGSHIGQLRTSFISGELPPQFLMRYDYDFLYQMKCVLLQLREKAKQGQPMTAHSVLEELVIYLCNEEAQALIKVDAGADGPSANEEPGPSENWVFALFGDRDIVTFLYSHWNLAEEHPFHFMHWSDQR